MRIYLKHATHISYYLPSFIDAIKLEVTFVLGFSLVFVVVNLMKCYSSKR